jgi:hypothetical protein
MISIFSSKYRQLGLLQIPLAAKKICVRKYLFGMVSKLL